MSVRVMARVWEHSKQRGNALLLLLAIADFADDDGAAFPGIKRLSHKARVGEATCHRLLITLRRSGELQIEHGAGRMTKFGGTNLYHVTSARGDQLDLGGGLAAETGPKMRPGVIEALRGLSHESDRVSAMRPKPPRTHPSRTVTRVRARDANASRATGLRAMGTILNDARKAADG